MAFEFGILLNASEISKKNMQMQKIEYIKKFRWRNTQEAEEVPLLRV